MSKKLTIQYIWRFILANVYLLNMALRLIIWSGRRDWIEKILPLRRHSNHTIRLLIVIAIRKYGLRERLPDLKEQYPNEPLEVKHQIIKTVQNIGEAQEKNFLAQLSQAASKEEAIWAIKALVRLDQKYYYSQTQAEVKTVSREKETPTF
jgi:hypothetical protein